MTGSEPSPIYAFAEFRLDPRRRSLSRESGEPVALAGKPLDALIYLVERAGTPVPRAALMKALWPTAVVEDNSLTQAISALRRALGDDQGQQRLIATLSGRGYQFVGAVSVVTRAQSVAEPSPTPAQVASATRLRRPLVLGSALAVVALVALALVVWRYSVNPVEREANSQRSVAVLPFRNLSADANDAYFAAALHEEVLNRLARVGGLTVIGRTSVMSYADAAAPISAIARELDVDAVLEGSASRDGDRVRVSVRLVAADNDAVLWSELYDGALGDVFAMQTDIATKIATALEAQLSADERTSIERRPTQSLEAYALYLRALALYRAAGGIGPAMPAAARAEMQSNFDAALAIDSSFAAAHAWKAYIHVDSLFFDSVLEQDWAKRSQEWIELVETNAARALNLDPESSVAYVARARLDLFRARLAQSRAALERALSLNPNDSQALQQLALLHGLLAEFPQAIAAARRALELDPKNPGSYAPLIVALQLSGDTEAAAATAEAMIEAAPAAAIAYVLLARAEVARGNLTSALEALRIAERFGPQSPAVTVDFAVGYRRLGQVADAERLADVFATATQGLYVSPALEVAELLARGDDENALRQARLALESRELGAEPLALVGIQWNVWSLPALEQPQWRQLRTEMAMGAAILPR